MSKWMDERELKIAYATIFTLPGVPFLYYGDELGMPFMEGLTSKEGGFSRTGTRTPMQWNAEKNCGFSTSDAPYLPTNTPGKTVSVESEEKRQDSLYHTVKDIIALRHQHADLQADGDFEVLYVKENEYPLCFRRGSLAVLVNPAAQPAEAELAEPLTGSEVLFGIGDASLRAGKVKMGPQSFAVVRL